MISTRSFCFIFIEFHRRFKTWNPKIKRFLNETVFLNFIHAITSTKFFTDSATKAKTSNSNNLKIINVLNSIIFASSTLMQMSGNVVENSNLSKHFSLTRLNESVKIKWKIMILFVIGFDNLIVFNSSFCFFFSFFWLFSRVDPFASHHTPAGWADGGGKWKKSRRYFFFLNWNVFKSGRFISFIEWNSCFSCVSLRLLCSFVEWTVYCFLRSQK